MFLSCGEALYDLFPSAETDTGFTFDARIGGSPFNVAIGLSRLGRGAALSTGLSSDPLGRRLERTLKDEGVATTWLVSKRNPTTLALVGLGPRGVPHYSFYSHDAADCSVGEADLPDLPGSVTAIHFGSYSLVVEPTGSSLLQLARRHHEGKLISLDPNIRLNVEPDAGRWRRRVEAFSEIAERPRRRAPAQHGRDRTVDHRSGPPVREPPARALGAAGPPHGRAALHPRSLHPPRPDRSTCR